jgi:hypothetical protein
MMPDDPQPLSAGERDVIQDVLAVGGSPQAQALRRYEATLQMLDVEYADIIRTQRAQIAALEVKRDAQAARLAAVEPIVQAAEAYVNAYPGDGTVRPRLEAWAALKAAVDAAGAAREGRADGGDS